MPVAAALLFCGMADAIVDYALIDRIACHDANPGMPKRMPAFKNCPFRIPKYADECLLRRLHAEHLAAVAEHVRAIVTARQMFFQDGGKVLADWNAAGGNAPFGAFFLADGYYAVLAVDILDPRPESIRSASCRNRRRWPALGKPIMGLLWPSQSRATRQPGLHRDRGIPRADRDRRQPGCGVQFPARP